MKPTILTQKTVCAFLGLMMALTILWAAKAEAKVDRINEVIPMEFNLGLGEVQENVIQEFELDLSDLKELPTITIINKYGEVVAEFYGDKEEIKKKFKGSFEKALFVTDSVGQEFYLVR
ncbi:hypothetical protein [Aquiflexum gelatinilyticum]|uniref:hypothetical protein n=1 Tax=Aquiflexum gelatinilyticum TaxID=2961943 RepID=UPI00216A7856|nr:hypothetical protein [Aquiflexum gelatinilyticum]MCS4435597.1 hypothetical protein [Aquiflexum gelatinilyticum]